MDIVSNPFFCLSNTPNYKEVNNIYPQATYEMDDVHVYDILKNMINKPVQEAITITFNLAKKTKATDVLSQSYITSSGLLISNKLFLLLQDFGILHTQFIQCSIKHEKTILNYYWLHPVKDFLSCIDFEKTDFTLVDKGSGKTLYEYKAKSRDAFIQKTLAIPYDKAMCPKGDIYFIPDAGCKTDIIFLPGIDLSIFISERLRNVFIQNSITGAYISNEATNIIAQ
jgi:hypothetical protein